MYSDSLYVPAGGMYGDGWFDDAKSYAKKAVKQVQSNPLVRSAEHKLVQKGADALRGVAESATDGLADSALTAIGAPELAPLADKLIDSGAKRLEQKGVSYLGQKIDQSGKGVRYMAPRSGGGMRLSGQGTQIGRGLRLAGNGSMHGYGMQADGLRLSGQGLRLSGSGHAVKPHFVRGSGHACACH
eukprot:COSAG02_NODE_2168_length_9608_cov_38.056893_2_plen_186_part_00